MKRIPHSVTEQLGHYVYAYVRPSDGCIRYVGKGQGQRAIAHLTHMQRHRVNILAHGLLNEDTAFIVEAAVIDALGLPKLVNRIRGKRSTLAGRMPLNDLLLRYAARPINIREPSILIRINQRYRRDMSARGLYEATRSAWVIGKRREGLKYAMAVFDGVVREVYRIDSWRRVQPASTSATPKRRGRIAARWEFTGPIAGARLRQRYIGGSVKHLLPDGAQNPIRYVL